MPSNAAGASLGPRKRFDGMAKLLDRSRRFVIPAMRREAYTPMTTSTAMMTLSSNANTNMPRYQLRLPEQQGTIQQHQFNLIYAKACGIGTESLEYIYAKLRSKEAMSSMAENCVNPEDRCDGDHCFHRLMMISNSIYFCFPVDHSTNRCCSYHRMNANDWCYTLTLREYVNGN